MVWLRNKLNRVRPAYAADVQEPDFCVPEDLPVHRPEVIAQLGTELPAAADALRYRDNFARLLPQRIHALTAEIRSKDEQAAVATLLSLNVGSSMVGAPRLQHVAGRCLRDIRSGRPTSCLPTLVREAERFLSYLAGPDEPAEPAEQHELVASDESGSSSDNVGSSANRPASSGSRRRGPS